MSKGCIAKTIHPLVYPVLVRNIRFKTVEIAVTPVEVTAVVAVEGKEKMPCSAAEFYGNQCAPAAKTTVGIIKAEFLHAILAVNSVIGNSVEIVSADKITFIIYFYE